MGGWIGVDLDGTLAEYGGWVNETHIGKPIQPMVDRVKDWLAEGVEVRIFTARVNEEFAGRASNVSAIVVAIEGWCVEHIGQKLAVTYKKDYGMVELWDDRCIQVICNTGLRADGRT